MLSGCLCSPCCATPGGEWPCWEQEEEKKHKSRDPRGRELGQGVDDALRSATKIAVAVALTALIEHCSNIYSEIAEEQIEEAEKVVAWATDVGEHLAKYEARVSTRVGAHERLEKGRVAVRKAKETVLKVLDLGQEVREGKKGVWYLRSIHFATEFSDAQKKMRRALDQLGA